MIGWICKEMGGVGYDIWENFFIIQSPKKLPLIYSSHIVFHSKPPPKI
jgi:hypothetical protein